MTATLLWAVSGGCERPEEDACSSVRSTLIYFGMIGAGCGIAITLLLALLIKLWRVVKLWRGSTM